MDKSVKFLCLNICYVLYVLLWNRLWKYWLMWFESLLVFILFKFKKRPNISGIRVVHFQSVPHKKLSYGFRWLEILYRLLSWFLYFYNKTKLHRKEACLRWRKKYLIELLILLGYYSSFWGCLNWIVRLCSSATLFSKFALEVYVNYSFIKNTAINIMFVYCIYEMQLCFINITVSRDTPTACLLTLWNGYYWI